MFKVKTKLAPSTLHGTGVFAAEFIAKGTVLWEFDGNVDSRVSIEDYLAMDVDQRGTIDHYGYLHARTGFYILCGDHGKNVNHSTDPNTMGCYHLSPANEDAAEGFDVATRDIMEGEEITCDYKSFDHAFPLKGIPTAGEEASKGKETTLGEFLKGQAEDLERAQAEFAAEHGDGGLKEADAAIDHRKKVIETVANELRPQVEQGNKIQELRKQLIKKGVVLT
jgi:hypothetical protein